LSSERKIINFPSSALPADDDDAASAAAAAAALVRSPIPRGPE